MSRRFHILAPLLATALACGAPAAAQDSVSADKGSVAIGGDVENSTINIGVAPEVLAALVKQQAQHSETQRKLITELESKLAINERQIRAALGIVGENNIAPENLAAKLVEIAGRFRELQDSAFAAPGDSPEIAALKAEADEGVEAGELDKADALLAEIETAQQRAVDAAALNVSQTSARRGELALTRLRYLEAARHFAKAAAALPDDTAHDQQRLAYLDEEADALYRQGDEFGDNGALVSAIERLKQVAKLRPRERVPLDWAATQNNLGVALRTLGERESGTARLDEAVAAYRAALEERTRERAPLDWAAIQNNLGNALAALGERESGTARLGEAVAAYRAALEERTRERVPLKWANTQNNLGNALKTLGERESGTARLEEAMAAYRAALEERTRERVPLDWAMTQNNLGNALAALGERESGTARLGQAVAVYRAALEERTRERAPLQWATTRRNLGEALYLLGERTRDAAKIGEGREAVQAAWDLFRSAGYHQYDEDFSARIAQFDAALAELDK